MFQTLQQISCLLLASSLPEGEPEVVTQSDEGGGGPLGLAQRVPLKETRDKTHTRVRWDPPGMGEGAEDVHEGFPSSSEDCA